MSQEVQGKIHVIMDIQQVTDSFKKREFVLEIVDGAYTQLVKFQSVQDNCEKLDGFKIGDDVKVNYNLRGREWKNKEGVINYFTNLDAWKVEHFGESNNNNKGAEDDLPF